MNTTAAGAREKADSAARLSRLETLARDGRLAEAKRLALEARAEGVRAGLVHHLVAMTLQDQRRYAEAIAELGLGLALEPNDPGMTTTTGLCLLRLDRHAEAARVLEAAIRLAPNSAEAFHGYGTAASHLGAIDAARSAWERAVALDANHVDALVGLSRLAVRRGEWAKARSYAERALKLFPAHTDVPENLARIELAEKNFEAAERRLRAFIPTPSLHPTARAAAIVLLGDALDGQGRFREAFQAYTDGKAELRALYAPEFESKPGNAAPDGARRILADFKSTRPESWLAAADAVQPGPQRGHVFVLGFARSGTTLLEQILATHPDTAVAGELPLFMDSEREFFTQTGDLGRLAEATNEQLEPFRQAYWRRARELGIEPTGKVFVDKQPFGAMALPLIHKMFPEARVIFLTRDPRDVTLSCFRRNFRVNPVTYEFTTLQRTAEFYALSMETMRTFFDVLPLAVHRLRYEDLVGNFDTHTRSLCEFLGLEWTEDLRKFGEGARFRPITTPSSVQVGRGLYRDGMQQWRNYDFALQTVAPILKPWIEAFGYPAD